MSVGDLLDEITNSLQHTSIREGVAIATAIFYVVLATRENYWCWIFGIVSSIIYIKINFDAKLYLEAWLCLYYVLIGFYGWYSWKKKENGIVILTKLNFKQFIMAVGIGCTATFILGTLCKQYSGSPLPYFDGALASFSLVATFLTSQKILENWIFWVVINLGYVTIYLLRALPATAILFMIYTLIAIYGYLKWKKNLNKFVA